MWLQLAGSPVRELQRIGFVVALEGFEQQLSGVATTEALTPVRLYEEAS